MFHFIRKLNFANFQTVNFKVTIIMKLGKAVEIFHRDIIIININYIK